MPPVIGRFEIVREIGKSPLGTVYKAYDPKRKHTVALRVLRADVPDAAERGRQYLLNARAASALDSPNIVSIYTGAEDQGLIYVAMEYVEGISLDTTLATEHGLPASELIDISRQVCRALDHAHSKDVVHRALTPQRIVTEWDGTVKILDFGLDPWAPEQETALDEMQYMAPEQLQGNPPNARSNLFSWGVILYEMAAGQKAFAGHSAEEVRHKVLEVMPPAPHEVNPKAHAALSRVIMKALAKNPEERFQSGADLVSELENEYRGQKTPAGVPQVVVASGMQGPAQARPHMISGRDNSFPTGPSLRPAEAVAPPAPVIAPPAPSIEVHPMVATPPASSARAAAPATPSPSPEQETVAPTPRAPVASGSISLSQRHVKVLVGVIGAALVIMIGFMIIDSIRARRMRAEAEAAAVAPLVGTGAAEQPSPPLPLPSFDVGEAVQSQIAEVESAPAGRALKAHRGRKNAAAQGAPLLGEIVITSVPDGAHVQVDGAGGWTTPVSVANLSPGQHVVVLSMPGYAAETRNVTVNASSKSFVAVSMPQLGAVASIASEPAGASIIVDGRDSGRVTPAKLTLGQGNHSVALRKAGYLETSTSMFLNPGDTFQFVPTLKPLGNADDIKQVGKFKKLIGRGGQENAGRVMVRTFPKGAQIMFNQRMMDRGSPTEFLLGPGTYEVNLTLTGYKPIHTVITVEPGARLEVDETFQR